jgi:hypothetical protein
VARLAGAGGFDLLVDDGSHNPKHQFAAIDYLWEAVKPGGIYVIEVRLVPPCLRPVLSATSRPAQVNILPH